uniref:Putative collagen type VI alpha 3 isoform 5 n=1 Tax=Latrodectus hesperus TaxID=256737 RepID=E7D1W3_LATHE|nr:putative collagen type VI alpha 3 isoform 5 [Latrodectus hesperus]
MIKVTMKIAVLLLFITILTGFERVDGIADVCKLTAHSGSCRAAFRRWAYEAPFGKCMIFIYGGCGGNGNNFKTQEECEKTCGGKN